MIEVVVVTWARLAELPEPGAAQVAARLEAVRAAGIDVVVDPAGAGKPLDLAADPGLPGRLVVYDGPPAGAQDWARRRLAGSGAPAGAVVVDPDLADLDEAAAAAARRPGGPGPAWSLVVEGADPGAEGRVESWLAVGNGRTGTRGSREEGGEGSTPACYVAGVFGRPPGEGAAPALVPGPEWVRLDPAGDHGDGGVRRTLDLRAGALFREGGGISSVRFASLADADVAVIEAEGVVVGPAPLPAVGGVVEAVTADVDGGRATVTVRGRGGGAASFAMATTREAATVRRLVGVGDDPPAAAAALGRAEGAGPDRLWAAHRRAWRERWAAADVVVGGDPRAQLALRFALYHLISAGPPGGDRASIGARALTGPGYRGHVFWDTDVFVLPFFAWTHPATARALLAYRYRTLPAARAKAAHLGYRGALYAWESADSGEETTPEHVWLPDGSRLDIVTGVQEHHISADVAWAVDHYHRVTGDDGFMAAMGVEMVVETARFWASRVELGGDGRHHIRGVIGPDEYHEGVDDNAFTNGMARWNLRAADRLAATFAECAAALGVEPSERQAWLDVAATLVDGYQPATGRHEEFAGFDGLEDVRAADLAPRPFGAALVLGVDRLRRAQVVKQAAAVMLGVLLAGDIPPEVVAADFGHYEPRTSHGSSLSPAMHALVAARVGALDAARAYFAMAGALDLDDLMGNSADGVHIATMGGLWQAAVFGFGGVRAEGGALKVDPALPPAWTGLAFTLTWRGARVGVEVSPGALVLDLDEAAAVAVGAGPPATVGPGRVISRRGPQGGWSAPGPA